METIFELIQHNISLIIGITLLLVWLLVAFLFSRSVAKNKGFNNVNRLIYESIPSMFTTIGIFGTFLGILVGLFSFDVKNIDGSITNLLNGLKTAFITSLLGLIFSFVFSKITKMQIKKYTVEQTKELPELISASNKALTEISKTLANYFGNTENSIKSIETNLNRIDFEKVNDIHTLIKQELIENNLVNIREMILNNKNEILLQIQELSKIIAESNTKALVEVMKQATEEFNKQMSAIVEKLVKENFDQLNLSVERMNTWQQENKEMIVQLTNQFKQVANEFAITSESISQIVENTKKLTNENSVLQKLIEELRAVMIEDKKFQTIINSVDNSVDLLKNTITELSNNTTQLSKWTDGQRFFADNVNSLIDKLNEVKDIKDINEIFWKNLEKQLLDAVGIVKDANNQLNNNLSSLDEDFRNRLNSTLISLDSLIKRIMLNYDNKLN